MAFMKVAVPTALNRKMDSESRKEAISRALASGGTVIIGPPAGPRGHTTKMLSDLLHCYHINIGTRLLVQALLEDIPTKYIILPLVRLCGPSISPPVPGSVTGKCIPYEHENRPTLPLQFTRSRHLHM